MFQKKKVNLGMVERVSNIVVIWTTELSRDTYSIMGRWKNFTDIMC